jgi:hypothetical protein
MIAILHCRLPLLGAALLLLLAAGSARAECGDYLHIGSKKSAPAEPAPKPCDGPHCSQHQFPPVPPAPVPPSTFSDESCCVASPVANPPAPRSGWIEPLDVRAADSAPTDIFDPPR